MNTRILLLLFILTSTFSIQSEAQYYRSEKRDTIKKVIPPQVYGNPKAKKRADSLAVLKRMKELEQEDKAIKKDSIVIAKTIMESKVETSEQSIQAIKTEPISTIKIEQPQAVIRTEEVALKNWNLLKCVNYARENNLQVKSAVLNERLAQLQLEQTRKSRLPNLNADASVGESYGRSIDPTSNQFVTKGFLYNSVGLNSQTLLFGWFQKKYQAQQNNLDLLSTYEQNAQLKDDISLNVATGFLRVLLAREQIKIAEAQLVLDQEQMDQTQHFADAGKIPELNVSQMQAQLANDSSNLVSNRSEEQLALLQLKALLNLNFKTAFDIEEPNLDVIEISDLYMMMTPDDIFDKAVKSQHQMKSGQLRVESAKKALRVAKSSLYPQLALFASLGTNYSSTVKNITGQKYAGDETVGFVTVNSTQYPITVPRYTYTTATTPIFDQYNQNLRANGGLSISVPLLNGSAARLNIERARIGIKSQELAYDVSQQKLKQDIYTAHQQVIAARQKYIAAKKAEDASKRALEFAKKRYAIGMINTFEYTSVQNTFNQASASRLSSKYDLIFKLKVLDYYTGNPIKL